MLPEIPESNRFSRNGGRSDHRLQQPPQKKLYHKPNISNFKDKTKLLLLWKVTALNLCSALPSIKWFVPAWNGPRVKAPSLPTRCPQLYSVVWSLALQIKRPKRKKQKNKKIPYLAISTQLYSFQAKHHLSGDWNSARRMSLLLSFHF